MVCTLPTSGVDIADSQSITCGTVYRRVQEIQESHTARSGSDGSSTDYEGSRRSVKRKRPDSTPESLLAEASQMAKFRRLQIIEARPVKQVQRRENIANIANTRVRARNIGHRAMKTQVLKQAEKEAAAAAQAVIDRGDSVPMVGTRRSSHSGELSQLASESEAGLMSEQNAGQIISESSKGGATYRKHSRLVGDMNGAPNSLGNQTSRRHDVLGSDEARMTTCFSSTGVTASSTTEPTEHFAPPTRSASREGSRPLQVPLPQLQASHPRSKGQPQNFRLAPIANWRPVWYDRRPEPSHYTTISQADDSIDPMSKKPMRQGEPSAGQWQGPQDPLKYAMETLAEAMGLNPDGTTKTASRALRPATTAELFDALNAESDHHASNSAYESDDDYDPDFDAAFEDAFAEVEKEEFLWSQNGQSEQSVVV